MAERAAEALLLPVWPLLMARLVAPGAGAGAPALDRVPGGRRQWADGGPQGPSSPSSSDSEPAFKLAAALRRSSNHDGAPTTGAGPLSLSHRTAGPLAALAVPVAAASESQRVGSKEAGPPPAAAAAEGEAVAAAEGDTAVAWPLRSPRGPESIAAVAAAGASSEEPPGEKTSPESPSPESPSSEEPSSEEA